VDDVSRIQSLYGPPVPVTPPVPPTTPPGGTPGEVVIRIRGASSISVDGYNVTPKA
jgi:hypothetical protein